VELLAAEARLAKVAEMMSIAAANVTIVGRFGI